MTDPLSWAKNRLKKAKSRKESAEIEGLISIAEGYFVCNQCKKKVSGIVKTADVEMESKFGDGSSVTEKSGMCLDCFVNLLRLGLGLAELKL